MKKHIVIIIVSVMLLILLSSCSVKSENTDTLLYIKGLELIQKMDLMAETPEYIQLMSASPELEETIGRIGEGNYSKPKTVYQIKIPEGSAVSPYIGDKITKLPVELRKDIERRFISAIPARTNALNSSTFVAATSVIAAWDSFINDGLKSNTLYIYLYEGEYSAMVSFLPGNENIIELSAGFVINDSLNQITSDSEMSQWLENHAFLINCEIEEVELAK